MELFSKGYLYIGIVATVVINTFKTQHPEQ